MKPGGLESSPSAWTLHANACNVVSSETGTGSVHVRLQLSTRAI